MSHAALLLASCGLIITSSAAMRSQSTKINVAHRGASAYAPEHTLAAYRLALEQGADYVEQDLAVTRDGVLICLHDPTLERTTNVEQLFPERATTVTWEGKTARSWLANDFTLAEIKTLDAGSWFGPEFSGERIPTFDEAVALIKGKVGIFPELKTPEVYAGRPVDFERLVADALDKHGLLGARKDARTPVIVQTFSEVSAKTLARMKIGVPVILLLSNGDGWESRAKVQEWANYVQGLGPDKNILAANPRLIEWAHAEGLTVIPYTFRSASPGKFVDVAAEMRHYLYTVGVDGLFTDNPDLFPRR